MKSIKFIIIELFLITVCLPEVEACWSPEYSPGEYYVFKVYDENNDSINNGQEEENVAEWQTYTSKKATQDDIYQVVYNYSTLDMEYLLSLMDKGIYQTDNKNTFVQYLFSTKDRDAIALLLLAKKCYNYRTKRDDPWWYPTKEDLKYGDLQSILDEALAYKGTALKQRYLLQAIRAAITMGEDDICMELWEKQIKNSPNSVIKRMSQSYIAGILFRREKYEEAAPLFIGSGDETSFWWCANQLTNSKTDIQKIEILHNYSPNSPSLAKMLQQIVFEAERAGNIKRFVNDQPDWYLEWYSDNFRQNRKRYISLRDLSLKIARQGKTDNPAMWQYAASFLTMMDGKPLYASKILKQSANMKGTPDIKEKIKIFQFMLDAINGSYDTAFEQKILPQLKWLDQKIRTNITDEVRKKTIEDTWMMHGNYSYYYYNDMMRKIAISIISTNYLKRRNAVKAAAFAGMGTELLPKLIGLRETSLNDKYITVTLEEYRKDTVNWNMDYSNELFLMLDTIRVQDVIAYKDYLFSGGKTELDRFLIERCYKNKNYFNELIGTKYIRAMQFDKAVAYLKNVDDYYEKTLNIYKEGYLNDDPFYPPWVGREKKTIKNKKLNFCIKMNDLKNQIRSTRNKNEKAQYEYKYAIGLAQIISNNWALAAYGRGNHTHDIENHYDLYSYKFNNQVNKYLTLAQKRSSDKNLQSQCIYARSWLYWDIDSDYDSQNQEYTYKPARKMKYLFSLLAKNYAGTPFVLEMQTQCDLLADYIASK